DILRSDGSTIIVSNNSHLYRDKAGNVAGMEGSCRDITERKKMEEEHRKIEKLESIGIMAGGIAHDFNNILTTILGNIELAKNSASDKNELFDILGDAEQACRHAKNLTSQLLTFSKGGAPVKKVTDIRGLLRKAADFVLRGSNVRCDYSLSEDLWPVEADEGQITQVIHNIVINANQAMPDGGTIRIFAGNMTADLKGDLPFPGKEYIKISIKDEGTGIPQKHIAKIFDPYFTTKQTGSGLGLTSTFSIIKNHDGYIDVESQDKNGTTFNIFLPASKGKPLSDDRKPEKIVQGSGKILVMDDEETVRNTVQKMLRHIGYDTEVVRDGDEAVELYKKAKNMALPFDAVIMDLTIRGGMGGRETINKLLEIDPEVKAIVSSGYSNDPLMSEFSQHGFIGVLTKPYSIEELNKILSKIVNRTGSRTA
ncbi:MAG: response regulator, partial [Nitrospirae bacterium]|nr:response regulator [Nitrospirota bacterium]